MKYLLGITNLKTKTIYLLAAILLSICTTYIYVNATTFPPAQYASQGVIYIDIVKPKQIYKVKMSAVGDFMVHDTQYTHAYNSKTKTYNFHKSFEDVKSYLSSADISVGNLETTFAGKDRGYSGYPCFNTPDAFASAIKDAGIDLVTTANNHSMDKGIKGLQRTIQVLDNKKIAHVGTYSSEKKRDTIYTKTINNIKFAFISYTYGVNGISIPTDKKYSVNMLNKDLIKSDIERAKKLNPDFVVVFAHMGTEYETAPNSTIKNWVKMIGEAGADIILASHPHVLQPMKYVKNDKHNYFVIYSLGNFISSQRTAPRDTGIILNFYFEKEKGKTAIIKKITYTPTWVKFRNKKGSYDIKILPVYETLNAIQNGTNVDLKQFDINRLKAVEKEVTKMYKGKSGKLTKKEEIWKSNL